MSADTAPRTSYDDFPYPGYAYWFTHPDHLGVLGSLYGLDTAPSNACRVLELGCGDGGNLLPIAALAPESRFVGVDLSATEIRLGMRRIGELGLSNIELVHADLRDLGDRLGTFDYVIAHGLLSWIPADARVEAMRLIGRSLAPDGVAMVSFNTYPGWHDYEPIRRLMAFHVASVEAIPERVQQARDVARWYCARVAREAEEVKGNLMVELHQRIAESSDSIIAHDYLSPHHHPFWFDEFAALSAESGLQYVASARQGRSRIGNFDADVAGMLRAIDDPVRQQQYIDFFSNTRFRTAVLCRSDRALDRAAGVERFAELFVESRTGTDVWHETLRDREQVSVITPVGGVAVQGLPLRITLSHLYRRQPVPIDFDSLFGAVLPELQLTGADEGRGNSEEGRAEMVVAMVKELARLYFMEVIHLWRIPPPMTLERGDRPRTGALQRLQAREGTTATTLGHRHTHLDPVQRQVLARLDGETSIDTLRAEIDGDVDDALGFLTSAGFLLAPGAD
ncbi:MAG: methyltransferase domain-containing protein [Deltaproteobacteria bacterium]|nr:MAG: methyltransferase domain-containing protein [Deltaproteobacteria bacterium]